VAGRKKRKKKKKHPLTFGSLHKKKKKFGNSTEIGLPPSCSHSAANFFSQGRKKKKKGEKKRKSDLGKKGKEMMGKCDFSPFPPTTKKKGERSTIWLEGKGRA